MSVLLWAIPVFMVTMLLEWRLSANADVKGYIIKDSAASIAMGLGNLAIMFSFKILVLMLYMALYEYRLFTIPTDAWWVWLLLIPCDDFCYYWYHRTGHEVRLFWAGHVNHHSSTTYNLSTALRQSWTSPLMGWIFWLPLPLLGFHPLMIVLAQSFNLLYQYWIHTELIGTMGPLESVMNTPSHHRVHHGRNPEYLDRNHGGIFIIWDRIFGTFEPEKAPVDYGLTQNIDSHNPIVVAFHEWHAMLRDIKNANTWRGRAGYLLGPPGWREDGTGKTSAILRQEALSTQAASNAETSGTPKGLQVGPSVNPLTNQGA